MTREIRFRAWDKETKDMVYDGIKLEMRSLGYYDDEIGHKSCSQKCEKPCKEDNGFIGYVSDCPAWAMMQYAGLKDKNGREAYHKDIVRRSDRLYIIEWHNNLAGWYLEPIGGGWHGITRGDMALMCEVIGNIYETPELLKEAK